MDFMQLIGSYGFPIVACIVMAMYVKERDKRNAEQLDKMIDKYDSLNERMTSALNNNTEVMARLSEKLGCEK